MGKRLNHQIKSPSVATEGSDFSAKNPTPTQAQHNNLKNPRQARIMPVLSRVFPIFAKFGLSVFAILFLSVISINLFAKNAGAANSAFDDACNSSVYGQYNVTFNQRFTYETCVFDVSAPSITSAIRKAAQDNCKGSWSNNICTLRFQYMGTPNTQPSGNTANDVTLIDNAIGKADSQSQVSPSLKPQSTDKNSIGYCPKNSAGQEATSISNVNISQGGTNTESYTCNYPNGESASLTFDLNSKGNIVNSNSSTATAGCDPGQSLQNGKCAPDPTPSNSGGSTCGIASAGWMICPIVTTIAKWVDGMYSAVKNYLVLPINLLTSTQSTANAFIPYANIILAIVFLIIIYSEATGNGFGAMSNYNIKKTLPRLVIFAILVNISFYICAAMVDLSNIIGSNLDTFLSQQSTCQIMSTTNSSVPTIASGTVTQNLTATALKQGDQLQDSSRPKLCQGSSPSSSGN